MSLQSAKSTAKSVRVSQSFYLSQLAEAVRLAIQSRYCRVAAMNDHVNDNGGLVGALDMDIMIRRFVDSVKDLARRLTS